MIKFIKDENDKWDVIEINLPEQGYYKATTDCAKTVREFAGSCDLSSKETYLEWVATFKKAFKLVCKQSRRAKIGRKDSKPETYMNNAQYIVNMLVYFSTELVEQRKYNKLTSVEARNTAKEAV